MLSHSASPIVTQGTLSLAVPLQKSNTPTFCPWNPVSPLASHTPAISWKDSATFHSLLPPFWSECETIHKLSTCSGIYVSVALTFPLVVIFTEQTSSSLCHCYHPHQTHFFFSNWLESDGYLSFFLFFLLLNPLVSFRQFSVSCSDSFSTTRWTSSLCCLWRFLLVWFGFLSELHAIPLINLSIKYSFCCHITQKSSKTLQLIGHAGHDKQLITIFCGSINWLINQLFQFQR